jgi:ribokinase
MGRVIVVGSLYLLTRADVEDIPRAGDTATSLRTRRAVGGRGVAQALAARRRGVPVTLVAAVGDDDAGRWCAGNLAPEGVDARLQVAGHEQTGQLVVMAEGGDQPGATLLIPGANAALDGRKALVDTDPDDVALVQLDVPPNVVAEVLREADRRQLRVVVNASPYATVDPEAAALADPYVVGERDAALLADVGVLPRSLCVTFGRAGAVWDGLRVDSDDLGVPAIAEGGTEAFCGALAAGLAAGLERTAALRAAVAAAGAVDQDED